MVAEIPFEVNTVSLVLALVSQMIMRLGWTKRLVKNLKMFQNFLTMPEFKTMKNVIILCDSWYVKKNLVSIMDEYENL